LGLPQRFREPWAGAGFLLGGLVRTRRSRELFLRESSVRNTRVIRGVVLTALAVVTTIASSASLSAHERRQPKRVTGYFTNWGVYGRNYIVNDIKTSGSADKLTHIFYAFATVTPDLKCGLSDPWSDHGIRYDATRSVDGQPDLWWPPQLAGSFNQLQKLKLQYPHLKVMISVGGWTLSDNFSDAALTPASRQAFVASCVDMFIRGHVGSEDDTAMAGLFDGIDIDWEYPGAPGETNNFRPEDTQNFTALMAEFRKQLDAEGAITGKRYQLSAATAAAESIASKIELAKVSKIIDFFAVMAYDYHGAWNASTNFLAPLLGSPRDPAGPKLNVNATVAYYLSKGVPARKIDLGVPFYGIGWAGVPATRGGLYQSATGPAAGVWGAGVNDYEVLAGLAADPASGFKSYRDLLSGGSFWIYNPTTQVFWSYDDAVTARIKGEYAGALGLGGVFFWELSNDDPQATLLNALHKGVN
jgi:chitinase